MVFRATLTNEGTATVSDVAPVFQVVGGACNCVQGSLERQDPASGTWQPAPMPEGDGGNPLATASGPVTIGPGATVTVTYQLSLMSTNPPKAATAVLVAVDLATHLQVARTTADTQVTGP